jgi:hypothetical protein
MSLERFFKVPVHEVLDTEPTGKAAGYRYINSADGNLYEKQDNGSWLVDEDFGLGTKVSVTGVLGNLTQQAQYVNDETVTEALTPFFGEGNTMAVLFSIIWNDKFVIFRSDDTDYDMIIIDNNGEWRKTDLIRAVPSGAHVDSRLNLWVATNLGLTKYTYGEPDSVVTHMTPAQGSVPFANIKLIGGYGTELYIVQNETDDLKMAKYNGYQWEDLSDQIADDLSLGTEALIGIVARDLYVDSEGIVLLAINGANFSGKLAVYQSSVFTFKTVPGTPTYVAAIVKIGDRVFSVDQTSSPKIWVWSTNAVLSTFSDPVNGLCTNQSEVWGYSEALIVKAASTASVFLKDTVLWADLLSVSESGLVLEHVSISATKRCYLSSDDAHQILRGDMVSQWKVG